MKRLLLVACLSLAALCATQISAAQTVCCAGAGYPTGMPPNPCVDTSRLALPEPAPALVNAALPLAMDQPQPPSVQATPLKNGHISVIYGFQVQDLRTKCKIEHLAQVQFQFRFNSPKPVLGSLSVQIAGSKKGVPLITVCAPCALKATKSGDYVFQLNKGAITALAPYYKDGAILKVIAKDASSPIVLRIATRKSYPTMSYFRSRLRPAHACDAIKSQRPRSI